MSDSSTVNREVVKTDKRYRRILFTGYLGAVVLGIVVWKAGVPRLAGFVGGLPLKPRVTVLEIIAHSILLLFIPAALYLIGIGRKVCSFKAIPYPGMKVIHDTVVVRGKRALVRGRSMIILGTMMIVLVIVSIIATHRSISRMKHHPIFSRVFYGVEA